MKRLFATLAVIAAISLSVVACSEAQPTARATEQAIAQQNQAKLTVSTPIPVLPISQERNNLVKRATRINVQNLSSCVILFTPSGAVVGKFAVNGKVSSLNSYLLSSDQVIKDPQAAWVTGLQSLVVEQPDIDGAYGQNAEGIFFFDAVTDAYIEWGGPYFWSDQCLDTTAQPILVQATTE